MPSILEWIFYISLFIVFYTYIGYGILLFLIVKLKKLISKAHRLGAFEPDVTLLIAAYNEEEFIEKKIQNTLSLNYPKQKLKVIFVTDGSNDNTVNIIRKYEEFTLLHEDKRKGKISAINRAMKYVESPVVIFCDANTLLNEEAIARIARHYSDKNVGGVSGEKRVMINSEYGASGSGEGFYWKYESFLKRLDAELYSIVGAAGELFSIRTELFEEVEADTILDDFMISLRINLKGYRIHYEPEAYALEEPSVSMVEESKRKIRICAGGFQSIFRLKELLNFFKTPVLSFQYISHRVLRWALAPFALPVVFISSLILSFDSKYYSIILLLQVVLYSMAFLGWYLSSKNVKVKILYIPYYFLFMNWSVYLGLAKFLRNDQSSAWEKARRSSYNY